MDPSHIHLWRCFSGIVPLKTPRKIFSLLSKIKFYGEGEIVAFEHIFQFWKFCVSHNNTNESFICKLFTLTFTSQIKSWCDTLLVASIHTWEQFMHQIWHDFENYEYDDLCVEILDLRKNKEESLEYFLIRFMHLCYKFTLDDRPSINDLILHLTSLTNETYQLVDEESK
jgi:hypothetical protein